ncbi:MAG TPA: hypothetical protein VF457_07115 [Burkholderiaceae bacterium]
MNARFASTCLLAAALLAGAAPVVAQGVPLDDQALSDTWGQALLDLTNTSQGGYEFSRLTFNADISLSMNLSGLKLGTRTDGTSDVDIATMNFGRSDAGDAARTVAITNPYFEWVYSGDAGTANRQVVGMRLGFGGISGDVGLAMNTVSGALSIDTGGTTGVMGSNGARSTTLTGCSAACSMALAQVGGVTAGNADGASRDFFLSVLKTALTYPTTDPSLPASAQAQAGFWMNWTDRLKAINTTGSVPPNVAKIGP